MQIVGTTINTILNRTPLSAETNRKTINDRMPNQYLPELIKNNNEQRVKDILKHCRLWERQYIESQLKQPLSKFRTINNGSDLRFLQIYTYYKAGCSRDNS